MRTFPDIGRRVAFRGNCAIGPCSGVVTKHYPARGKGELDRVEVRVDEKPRKWPYVSTDVFVPALPDIKLVAEVAA